MERISKTDYYLGIAEEVAKRSTCIRRQYGAVIVKNDENSYLINEILKSFNNEQTI